MKSKLSYLVEILISVAASLWLGVLFDAVTTTPLRGILSPTPYEERYMLFALCSLGSVIGIVFSCRRFGYEKRKIDKTGFAIALFITFVVQHLVSAMLEFAIYAAGGANALAQIIHFGKLEFFPPAPTSLAHLCLLGIQIALLLPAAVLGTYWGVKLRKKEIQKLTETKES